MIEISRKYQKVRRNFQILTVEEAKTQGISPIPWREALPGQWALTDDGFAVECLRHIPLKNAILMEFSIARCMKNQKRPLLAQERLNTRDFWGLRPLYWREHEAKRKRTKNVVKAYANQIINRSVDFQVLGQIYRPDQAIPEATVRRLLKQEVIQNMVQEEVAKILSKEGVTPSEVVKIINRAILVAEKKGDAGNMLRGAEDYVDMLDMKPTKQQGFLPIAPAITDDDFNRLAQAQETYSLVEKSNATDTDDGAQETAPGAPDTGSEGAGAETPSDRPDLA